jgi:hypothetical protein
MVSSLALETRFQSLIGCSQVSNGDLVASKTYVSNSRDIIPSVSNDFDHRASSSTSKSEASSTITTAYSMRITCPCFFGLVYYFPIG